MQGFRIIVTSPSEATPSASAVASSSDRNSHSGPATPPVAFTSLAGSATESTSSTDGKSERKATAPKAPPTGEGTKYSLNLPPPPKETIARSAPARSNQPLDMEGITVHQALSCFPLIGIPTEDQKLYKLFNIPSDPKNAQGKSITKTDALAEIKSRCLRLIQGCNIYITTGAEEDKNQKGCFVFFNLKSHSAFYYIDCLGNIFTLNIKETKFAAFEKKIREITQGHSSVYALNADIDALIRVGDVTAAAPEEKELAFNERNLAKDAAATYASQQSHCCCIQ